jgi:polyisoprenoid-binding protein YceI
MKVQALALVAALTSSMALAAPVTYNVDPAHTHPEFEADHMGGVSVWRGIFKQSSGTITVDKDAGTGTVNVDVATASIDFGHDKLNEHASGPEMFDVTKFPTANFKGKLGQFANGAPTQVDGELTLHGVTKPMVLKINSFKCIQHPVLKREVCGADASTTINRADFGISYGEKYGFKMDVVLHISVEAIKAE